MQLLAALALLAGSAAAAPAPTKAVALLFPAKDSGVRGTVSFRRTRDGVRIVAHLTGLAPGKHGFHIHEYGDCSGADFASAGSHFNPSGEPHAGPHDARRHAGDLGNIEADQDGVAHLEYVDPRASFEGPGSILGRGLIVHAAADDFETQPTGNAGGRLACGVIGVMAPE